MWLSTSYSYTHNTTYDGKTYNDESNEILFGSFFFLSNIRSEHERKVYNIMDLITELGGIGSALIAGFSAMGAFINT